MTVVCAFHATDVRVWCRLRASVYSAPSPPERCVHIADSAYDRGGVQVSCHSDHSHHHQAPQVQGMWGFSTKVIYSNIHPEPFGNCRCSEVRNSLMKRENSDKD